MKHLKKTQADLVKEGRWDLDYHLPPEGIQRYPNKSVATVAELAAVSKLKHDPTSEPDATFQYIDIASIDVTTGVAANVQELTGSEAPSRARMVVKAFDVIVSTCRPTRGAIAVVPRELHNEICSTGFCVLRPKAGVNPYYLHYVLRLAATLEQFRKWSTGSSYPAILDEDVLKTRVPAASPEEQDAIAQAVVGALAERNRLVEGANKVLAGTVESVDSFLRRESTQLDGSYAVKAVTLEQIENVKKDLAEETPILGAVPEPDPSVVAPASS